LRERVLADPKGRAAYDRAREEITAHQANLATVRKMKDLAQATVADALGMSQGEISRLERRSDLLLSTLRRFIEATGGELHLVARYPEADVDLMVGISLDQGPDEGTSHVAVNLITTCDLCRSSELASGSVSFGYGGKTYVLDLCDKHLLEVRAKLERYGTAGHADRAARRPRRAVPSANADGDLANEIRTWGGQQGYQVGRPSRRKERKVVASA
jgi:transcriptional regulator with XRE-family HTH domain